MTDTVAVRPGFRELAVRFRIGMHGDTPVDVDPIEVKRSVTVLALRSGLPEHFVPEFRAGRHDGGATGDERDRRHDQDGKRSHTPEGPRAVPHG